MIFQLLPRDLRLSIGGTKVSPTDRVLAFLLGVLICLKERTFLPKRDHFYPLQLLLWDFEEVSEFTVTFFLSNS